MWQDSLNTTQHERLLKSPVHTACEITHLTVDQCVYRDFYPPLTSSVFRAARLSPPPALALGWQPLRVRDGPHQRLRSGSHNGCWWVPSMRNQPVIFFFVIRCLLNDKNSTLSSLRSSSFPQVTSAPSWWSTRRRCTSLQTVGRHGDRYVSSSFSRSHFASPSGSVTLDRSVSLLCQVFEEEHHILYLDHGGVIVAIKDTSIPLKILK